MKRVLQSRWLSIVLGTTLMVIGVILASNDNSIATYIGLGLMAVGFLLFFNGAWIV